MFTIRSCSMIYILVLLFASIQFTWSIGPQYHEDIYPKTSLSNNDGGNEEHDGNQVYQPSLNTTSDPMTHRTQSQLPLKTLESSTKKMTKRKSTTSSSKLLAWDTDSSSNASHRRLLFRSSRDQPYVISDNIINVTMSNASGITQSDKSLLSQALGLTNNSSDPSIREIRSRRQVECWHRGFCRESCFHGQCLNADQSDSKEHNPRMNTHVKRYQQVNSYTNRGQQTNPYINQDQPVSQTANWGRKMNHYINRDQPVNSYVNQDQQINQNTNWNPRVNPNINQDQPVNPKMNPRVNRHQKVNPHINRHQQVNPHNNQGQQVSPNVNQKSPVNPDENSIVNSNPVGSTNIGGKGGDGVIIINVFGGNGGKGGSTFTIRGQ